MFKYVTRRFQKIPKSFILFKMVFLVPQPLAPGAPLR